MAERSVGPFRTIAGGNLLGKISQGEPYPEDSGLLLKVDGQGNAVSVQIELRRGNESATMVDPEDDQVGCLEKQRIWASKSCRLTSYLLAAHALAKDLDASLVHLDISRGTKKKLDVKDIVEATLEACENVKALGDVVTKTIDKETEPAKRARARL